MLPAPASKRKFRNIVAFCAGTVVISFLITPFLGINILSNKQKNISQHFSKKQPKWNDTKFFLTQKNTPMIEDSLVNIHCQINKKIKQGDHIIFICKVIDVLINNKKNPLIYLNSNYI